MIMGDWAAWGITYHFLNFSSIKEYTKSPMCSEDKTSCKKMVIYIVNLFQSSF
jgi:hypothetical protein